MLDNTAGAITLAVVIPYFMEVLKKSPLFPWLTVEGKTVNRIVAAVAAFGASCGLHLVASNGGDVVTISGLHAFTTVQGFWHLLVQWAGQWAGQQLVYDGVVGQQGLKDMVADLIQALQKAGKIVALLGIAVGSTLMMGCATAKLASLQVAVDKLDRPAFTAVKGFQDVEEASWHGKEAWPTAAQHQQIGAKLSEVYSTMADIAAATIALQPGQTLAQNIVDEETKLPALVQDILALANVAPASVQTKGAEMKKAAAKFLADAKKRAQKR